MRILRHGRGNPETELDREIKSPPTGEAILTEKGGTPEVVGESDRLIVLRARESRVHGEGASEVTQPTKETSPRQVELILEANLPVGNSE